ncbi:MAG: EF-hand domain-containing protein [Silicimonas sp.]|nr:EF-hand domain-containing protein [Silicimonas sp.]
MTKRMNLTIAALLGLGLGTAAMAAVEDTDGDGVYSMEELLVVYPGLTEEGFGLIDTNGDGAVDENELTAAVDAGVLVAS